MEPFFIKKSYFWGFLAKIEVDYQNNFSHPFVDPKYIFCVDHRFSGLDATASYGHTDIYTYRHFLKTSILSLG